MRGPNPTPARRVPVALHLRELFAMGDHDADGFILVPELRGLLHQSGYGFTERSAVALAPVGGLLRLTFGRGLSLRIGFRLGNRPRLEFMT